MCCTKTERKKDADRLLNVKQQKMTDLAPPVRAEAVRTQQQGDVVVLSRFLRLDLKAHGGLRVEGDAGVVARVPGFACGQVGGGVETNGVPEDVSVVEACECLCGMLHVSVVSC